MPSEYIMYLSILLVGTLAIGGVSVTMVTINNSMEDRAIETNLENILQKITETIHDLIIDGESQIELGGTDIEIVISLTLPESIYEEEYIIYVNASESNYFLTANLRDREDISVTVSLLLEPTSINISGTIESADPTPQVIFSYNGELKRIILSS